MRISTVIRASMLAVAAMSSFSIPYSSDAKQVTVSSEHDVDASIIHSPVKSRALGAAVANADDDSTPAKKPKKKKTKKAKSATKAAAESEDRSIESTATEKDAADQTTAAATPKKKKKQKKSAATPAPEATDATDTANSQDAANKSGVKDKKIKGSKNEGVIDGSSEGLAEIDKIDLRNEEGWVSVYDDPPLLVIKASLYAFIAYNDTDVCDTFNMTMNAVEQKPEDNGRFSYHVVAYINCTKNGEDETQGRFILNFIPEGKRLLLTECGHREEGEIVNWLRIQDEVPECMTPTQRKNFLAQPMKHIHASNGVADTEAVQTDFLSRLEEFDKDEVAIVGTATIAIIAIIVALVAFVLRKRKAQKDLERTIAGAKAEHAVEDDDLQIEPEEKVTKERKGLMDSSKAKVDDPDMEEGSFVNSPAVRV
ncbi:uncharacterized protein PHALS_07791 [Plasmopara halstedii]|uniref:Uncharacterized protein n=1 Tax=Plasmopara halstedii TaxID=4781 RepID=A0A0P1B6Z7_PLAHL|nr:uncharacterized protein PHALS_07791 [Plasmopara halstedii]CEG50063.1 hypothetical protein PHALS_07791 [Plasmopara halstedii]|eukprot:XP_024586432.1 hypothetical protein PHALS_07791 [Plasmopara halstedii]